MLKYAAADRLGRVPTLLLYPWGTLGAARSDRLPYDSASEQTVAQEMSLSCFRLDVRPLQRTAALHMQELGEWHRRLVWGSIHAYGALLMGCFAILVCNDAQDGFYAD